MNTVGVEEDLAPTACRGEEQGNFRSEGLVFKQLLNRLFRGIVCTSA